MTFAQQASSLLPSCSGPLSHAADVAALIAVTLVELASFTIALFFAVRSAREGAAFALIAAVSAADEAAAYRALGRTGPIRRALVTRTIRRAIREAWAELPEGTAEVDVFRRAAVASAGRASKGASTEDAFAALAARLKAPPKPSRALSFVLLGALIAGLSGVGLWFFQNRDDSALRAIFKQRTTSYRIELNNRLIVREGDAAGAVDSAVKVSLDKKADAIAADVKKTKLGERGGAALFGLLAAAQIATTSKDTAVEQENEKLAASAAQLNKLLADARARYLVTTDVTSRGGRRTVQIFSFEVEERGAVCVEGRSVPIAHVRRIDEVNWSINGLSLVFDRQGIVVVSEIESLLVRRILPLLAPEAVSEMNEVEKVAVREEMGSLSGWDAKELVEVGQLIAMRSAILSRISRDVETFLSGIRYDTWKGRAPDGDLAELVRIEEKLERRIDGYKSIERAFALAVEAYAASAVRITEPDSKVVIPAELTALTGDAPALAPQVAIIARWIASDLAELGANPGWPRTQLALMSRALSDPGNFQWYAGTVVIEALARELGIAIEKGSPRSVPMARDALMKKPAAAINEAAKKARAKLYGSDGGIVGRCGGRDVLFGLGTCR